MEGSKDMTERLFPSVAQPPLKKIGVQEVYGKSSSNSLEGGSKPNWKVLMTHMHQGGFVQKKLIVKIVSQALKIFSKSHF